MNPVDTKQRTMPVDKVPRVLGFDAVGVIEKIGDQVSMFQEGDVVFIQVPNQNGSNEEYQLIEEYLVAKAPTNLKSEQAASLPLTGLTAYETLFDVLEFQKNHLKIKVNHC